MNSIVPVLITCDIDPTPEVHLKDKRNALDATSMLFHKHGIKGTFFFVANVAKLYQPQIRHLLENGHEIGCHGLTHELDEEYNRLPQAIQRQFLTIATHKLEDLTGNPMRSFRGPRVKTSHTTQQILEDLDYVVDSSVCSQRIDFISSNLINWGWIFAPRIPYQPSHASPYKRGKRNLWVVPISALILPFISGTLYFFGLKTMKTLSDIFYSESKHTGKPIVYLMHPAEFAFHPYPLQHAETSLQAIKSRGFYLRRKFKLRVNEKKRFELTNNLFQYIASRPDVQFMTVSSYIASSHFATIIKKQLTI